jgi:3-phenylpropionate/trans-cinnamate dioxygenase ferredoxin subunit
MAKWVSAGRAEDIPPERVKVIEVGEERIAVCNVDGRYCAIADVCTHDGGPLDQGELFGNEIECPRHGARFDVCTGKALTLPAVLPVKTYPVRVDDGEIQVEV